MRLFLTGIVGGLVIVGIYLLFSGKYLSSFFSMVPGLVLLLAKRVPNSEILSALVSNVDPVAKPGMLYSKLVKLRALFYAKITGLVLVVLYVALELKIDLNDLRDPLVLLIYALPLASLYLFLIVVINVVKLAYVTIFKKDHRF